MKQFLQQTPDWPLPMVHGCMSFARLKEVGMPMPRSQERKSLPGRCSEQSSALPFGW
jgi:hypothetical protein